MICRCVLAVQGVEGVNTNYFIAFSDTVSENGAESCKGSWRNKQELTYFGSCHKRTG